MTAEAPTRATFLAVAALSAAVLALEVLLVRLFSITGWHHFAYMIISIALLGFGASGSILALAGARLLPRFAAAFALGAALFGVTAVGSVALAMRLPFNALEVVWQPGELLWLGLSYLLLVLPFLFGGGALGLAFFRFPGAIGRLYAADLVGAGTGALGLVGLLFLVPVEAALRIIAALGLVAGAVVLLPPRRGGRTIAAAGLGAMALGTALWLPPPLLALAPHVSEYKGLAMALRVPGARVVGERSGPLGRIHVVESPTIPFRHAPGLSLANTVEPPPQLGVFTDADSMSAITRFDGNLEVLSYLDQTTGALPYHLLENPEVLVLGAGGGEQVLLALYHGAAEIAAVELNPQVVELVAETHAGFAGGIYGRPEVEVRLGEARSVARRGTGRYDLIQVPLLSSFGAAAAGTQSLHESYTYTVEALGDYLDRLEPGGLLSITLWAKLPPRDTAKLFATAVETLERRGVADPGRRLALIRSWKTSTLLVRNGAFPEPEIKALRRFAEERSFDVAWYPGISADEANRFNQLERPWFYEAAAALAGPGREAFIERYKFAIQPATDDRPYFHDFFRWRFLPELMALRTQGTAAMLDMGYLVLAATLAQAAALSLLLILAPLALRRRRFASGAPKAGVAGYFLALGLGFLLIEIAYLQRFILFLGNPLHAVAVVLAGFLVFAGLGSAAAPALDRRLARARLGAPAVAALGIGIVAIGYLFLLPVLFEALIHLPDAARIAISLALIAPLAFLMGLPFPLGIARVARVDADLVPWAWAINGCASVVAAVLATVLAMHLGFAAVVCIAVALYLAAPLALAGRLSGGREALAER
ncbi:MAG TPA: hypothetical protein VMM55_01025 [Thermohalobaculum sp.]|nr:hypothetical protein [Thermohalobaculum sp.]